MSFTVFNKKCKTLYNILLLQPRRKAWLVVNDFFAFTAVNFGTKLLYKSINLENLQYF